MVMKGSGAQEGDASCMAGLCIAAAPPNRGQGQQVHVHNWTWPHACHGYHVQAGLARTGRGSARP